MTQHAPQQQSAPAPLATQAQVLPALLLPASLTAQQALPRLEASDAEHLAVRRVEGLVVFWYVMPLAWALERVRLAAPADSLKLVLNLHEYGSAPVRPPAATALAAPLQRDAVVLDGERFVGIQTCASQAAVPREAQQQQQQQQQQQEPGWAPPPAAHPVPRMGHGGARGKPALPPVGAARAMAGRPPATGADDAPPSAMAPDEAAPPESAPAPAAIADTTFEAHPRLEAPDTVAPGQTFAVTVGLGTSQQPGVTGDALRIQLPAQAQSLTLDVLLIADGFEALQGWSAQLTVPRGQPDASSVRFELKAPALGPDESSRLGALRVLYSHEGQVCGTALRRIAVLPADRPVLDHVEGHGLLWTTPPGELSGAVNVDPAQPQVDLTVIIDKPDANPAEGRFLWRFTSALPLDLPATPLVCDLGTGSAELGGKIITEVQGADANGMAELFIRGLGRQIRNAAPPEFWPLLRQAQQALRAQGQSRPLNVLMLTAETHVPWELALLDKPERLLPDAPPLLGCQVNLGRWPLAHTQLPPPAHIDVRHMAAVIGDYAARSGWRKLDQAAAEGQALVTRYQAVQLSADVAQIKQLLEAELGDDGHGAEAVHFACHGEALQDHPLDAAIILGNGARLNPLVFGDAELGRTSAPFLFMNACQVGKAGELLASFSGFAGSALLGGFRGFLAPLWSVEDTLARDIALGFYEQAFGANGQAPRPVADILREMRAGFSDNEPHSITRLAYVYYGHPGLTLQRQAAPLTSNHTETLP